jgi:hypothetical protein
MTSCPPPGPLLCGECPRSIRDDFGIIDLECPLPLAGISAPEDRPHSDTKCQENPGDLVLAIILNCPKTHEAERNRAHEVEMVFGEVLTPPRFLLLTVYKKNNYMT